MSQKQFEGYLQDEAEFRDPAAAQAGLVEIAGQLRAQPDMIVTITGRTSDGPTAWPSLEAFGKARAELCADSLIAAGVPADQIATVRAGYLADPPVTDPGTAALNPATDFTFSPRN